MKENREYKSDVFSMLMENKAYNINPKHNQELKRKSPVLNGYTYFVEKVRDNQKKKINLTEAIDGAIEDCIENHVLEDFFRNRMR